LHKIYVSKSNNPYFNLAFEEYLVKNAKTEDQIYYLWQNDNTVVIGRNQNPWKECAWEKLEEDGGKLVRRLSGGGAVFHDLGNLNFTIIRKDEELQIERNIGLITKALDKFAIEAYFTGKNDMVVEGYKISGNAFVEEEGILCHHGTMLIDADLTKLGNYLKASELKLKSKGIDSVVARVKNLKEFNSEITVEKIIKSFIDEFKIQDNEEIH